MPPKSPPSRDLAPVAATPAGGNVPDDIWRAIASLIDNGPSEVGISAGLDDFETSIHKLPRCPNGVGLLASLYINPRATPKVASMAVQAAFIANIKQDLAEQSAFKAPAPVMGGMALTEEMSAPSTELLNMVYLLVFAAKVQWWQTNHHTGVSRGAALGYVAKAMTAIGLDPTKTADVQVIHQVSHWFDTKKVLQTVGVTGLPATISKWPLKPSADLMLRANANPAGTALVVDVLAIIELYIRTAYVCILTKEEVEEAATLAIWKMEAEAEWASYHIGAMFLTGKAAKVAPIASHGLGTKSKAFLEIAFPNSSLNRSAALKKIESDPTVGSVVRSVRNVITSENAMSENSMKIALYNQTISDAKKRMIK